MKRITGKLYSVLASALLLLTALAASATAQTASDPFAALPESELIVVVDIQRILNEAVPRVLAKDPLTLGKMNEGLDQIKALTGLDLRASSRLVIGAPSVVSTPTAQQFRGVIIAQVNDAEKLMSLIRKDTSDKLREEQYQGKTLFTLPKEAQPPRTAAAANRPRFDVAMSVLDAGTILFGTPAEVRASIDASAGRRPRASSDLIAAATRHPTSLFGMAMVVPPSLTANIFDDKDADSGGGDNAIAKAVSSIRQISAALGLTANGFDVVVAGRTDTDEQAKNFGDMLNGFKTLSTMSAPKNEQERMLQNFVKSVQITSAGSEVMLNTVLTQEMVEQFMASVKKEMNKAQEKTPPATKRPTRPTRPTRRGART